MNVPYGYSEQDVEGMVKVVELQIDSGTFVNCADLVTQHPEVHPRVITEAVVRVMEGSKYSGRNLIAPV
jgi:hypothetical protein